MIDIHRVVANVSFATGWTREYVLHSLTFAELVRYAEYAREWMLESSQVFAVSLGILRAPVQRCTPKCAPAPEPTDGGVGELLLRNLSCPKSQ